MSVFRPESSGPLSLSFEGVSKWFGQVAALSGVSFTTEAGVTGPNQTVT